MHPHLRSLSAQLQSCAGRSGHLGGHYHATRNRDALSCITACETACERAGAGVVPRTLRARLVLMVAAAALSLVTLTVTGSLVASRVEDQLTLIQRRYMPKLELGPKLESEFERVTRSLQDAVAAQDLASLDESAALKGGLSSQLSAAKQVLGARNVALARAALDDYFALAHDVSRRLIAGETGEQLVSAMSAMQSKQAHALELLRSAVAFDRNKLGAAFAEVSRTELQASRIRLVVSLVCLFVVGVLYYWLTQGIFRALTGLAAGFERFGRGEFEQPIALDSRDELAELAERANQMARSLQRLNSERDRSDWLKEGHARLMHELRGELEPSEVAERAVRVLARYLGAPAGALYYDGPDGLFHRIGRYQATDADGRHQQQTFRLGEGPAGAAATHSEISVVDAPEPRVFVPLSQLGRVSGVLELSCSESCSELHKELLLSVSESIAIALEVARAHVALEQKNAELDATRQSLEQSAAELRTVSAYKTQFLANMSHELRTPLNSMLLLSNLLAANDGKNLTAKQVEYCRTIHGAGKDLLALINQVLDLSKIEAGKQQVQIEVVPLQRWAEHAENIFGPVARHKGLEFNVELGPDCPETITTDGKRVEQILNNLLGNALKFTTRGSVSLRIAPCGTDPQYKRAELAPETTLEIRVKDTGVGIAAEHLERIFAPFEQADASQERRFGGTGLGLTIARELAELLGGELTVRSVLGEGTTFVCYLPYVAPGSEVATVRRDLQAAPRVSDVIQRAEPPNAPVPSAPTRLDGRRVLVTDDDMRTAYALSALLRASGAEVLIADSGVTALSMLQDHPNIDIVLLDVMMPDMDGFETLRQVRAQARWSKLPVITLTAKATQHDRQACLERGATAFMAKPVDGEKLIELMQRCLLDVERLATGSDLRS